MKKYFFIGICLIMLFVSFVFYEYWRFSKHKLSIVFCDVGQGDAVFIRTPAGYDILYDAGPDNKVLSCLENSMPFWDRKIELAFLSHPHADHFLGFLDVFNVYTISTLVTEELENNTKMYSAFKAALAKEGAERKVVFKGDTYRLPDGVSLSILGPSKAYLYATSPNGQIAERSEFASLVVLLRYKDFSVLLTGDSQVNGLEDALRDISLQKISVLHVPHHGSKTGLNKKLIDHLQPQLAVISVGKNNYGHPSQEILNLLRANSIEIRETIKQGKIEIVSDGDRWILKK